MNTLVKITRDDDGNIVDDAKWCLAIDFIGGANSTFCTGEFFGYGESRCEYELKEVARGGITCESCLENIKTIKSVRL